MNSSLSKSHRAGPFARILDLRELASGQRRPTRSRRKRRSLLTGASIAALLAVAETAGAVDGAWTSTGTGLWSDSLNWTFGTIADGTDATGGFNTIDLVGDVTVHLDSARTIGNLIFGDITVATPGSWVVDNNGSAANVLTLEVTSGAPTITVNALGAGSNATISAVLAGTGGLTKAGVGTLVLSGANTYSGSTTINAGTLAFGSAASIGGAGASVIVAANATVAANFAINQAFLARIDGSSAGVIALGANSGNNLDLSAANLGLVSLGATGAFSYSGVLAANGATYRLGGGGGNLMFVTPNALTGTNGLVVTNGGQATSTVTLGAANNFTGGTTINSGTLVATVTGALGNPANPLAAAGGTLDLGGTSHTQGAVTISSGTISNGTLNGTVFDGQSGTVSASLAGTGALTKTTAGILTLTGANTYTGGTTVDAGVLAFGSVAAMAGSGANIVVNSGGAAAATFAIDQAFVARIASSSTGAVALGADSSNALNLGGLPTSSLGSMGAFSYTGVLTPGAGVYRLGGGGGTLTLSGTNALTGANSLLVTSGGMASSRVALTAANDYGGGTALSGGILTFSALNNLGTGGLNFDGGTLQWAAGNTADISSRTITFGAGGGTLDLGANNVTLAAAIGNNGAGGLTKAGAGTLTLSGANTYSGGTFLNAGVVLISADAALGAAAGGVTFTGSSTLRFGAPLTVAGTRTLTINAGVTATLDMQANAITLAGPLAGSGPLTKTGSAILTYTGSTPSGFTGALNVTTGIFRAGTGSTLVSGALTVSATAGAQFHVNGGTYSTTALATVNQTGAGFLVDAGSASFSGGIRTNGDNGGVIRVSGGTFTASEVNVQRNSAGAVDFTRGFILGGGTSTVGTIRLGSSNSNGAMSVEGGTLTATGAVTIGNQVTSGRGGAMRVTSGTFTSTDTVDGIVLGKTNGANANNVATATFTGGVSKVEKFTLGFDSTVTAGSSTIAVNGGTLYVGSGGIVKNGTAGLTTAINLTAGLIGANADWASAVGVSTGPTATNNVTIKAASDADVAHDITINGGVAGSGGFTKTGGGKLIIGGNSTYTGGSVGTTISAGTLQVGSGGTAGTLGTSAVINNGILAFNRTDALAFANNISGSGALEHNGIGTTTLSGTNTYAGNTTINAGTLRAASNLVSPIVTVNSTGTLAGNGTLSGAVTVNSGGRLSPSDASGTAPGTLTLGNLTLAASSTLDVDFTSLSTFDKVVVTGNNGLTINGVGLNLYASNTATPWTTTGSYNLFQYTGALGGLAATNLNAALTVLNPDAALTYNFTSSGGFITLAIGTQVVIPTWIATGGGSWNTAANWNAAVPNAQGAAAKFGTSILAPSTVTLDGNKTVGSIEFGGTNAYTLAAGTGGTLTLSKSTGNAVVDNVAGSHIVSAPVNLASPTVVTVFDAADTLTVSGAVSGANSLTKSGLGTLALSGANNFSGGATLTAGTLRITHNQALGTAALTVSGNGTLQFGADNLSPTNGVVVNSGFTATIDTQGNSAALGAEVSGDGGVNKIGSGRLFLAGANIYNGSTTITAGTLSVNSVSDGGLPSPIGQSSSDAANLVLNGGTLEYTGGGAFTDRLFSLGTAGGGLVASGAGAVEFTNLGAIALAGTNTARTLTLSGTNTNGNMLSAALGNNGTGATSLTKSGPGTWILNGVGTFTGQTVVTGGVLAIGAFNALGGSTLNYDNHGGTIDLSLLGTLTLGGLMGAQNLPLGNAPALTIGGNGQSTTYSGSLTGAAALTKTGAGTLTLTGANELFGAATISGGTLQIGPGGTLVASSIGFSATSTLFHQTGGTVTAGLLNLENGSAQQFRATFDAGIATFTTTRLGATNATSAPCVLTINGGTIALGDYISQRDGSGGFNTTAGLIIHGGTVTASSVLVSSNNSWSNLTLTAGSLEIGTSVSNGAFFVGGGTNNARGGNLTMSGGTLTYQGIDGLVLNQSTGSSIGQATFSGGTANLSGITLNAATATGGSATLNLTGATVYLGAVGLQANTTGGATASVTLNGGVLGASASWTGNANVNVGASGITIQAADATNVALDIMLTGAITGAGTVTKTGTGTLTLTGAQNYNTLTTSAGVTDVDGSFTAGTATVNANATTNFGASQRLAALNIGAGATVTLSDAAPFAVAEGPAASAVPEPGSVALLLTGSLALLRRRRRA